MSTLTPHPSLMSAWARYCVDQDATFADYCRGYDLLRETDGYWLGRGFPAVLAAVEALPAKGLPVPAAPTIRKA